MAVCKQVSTDKIGDSPCMDAARPLKVLVLYDPSSCHTSTVSEHLHSLANFSKHHVMYVSCRFTSPAGYHLDYFDVLLVHYSQRFTFSSAHIASLSAEWVEKIQTFRGCKVVIAQDEYDAVNRFKWWMRKLGIHLLFSCVPEKYSRDIYPRNELPGLEVCTVLTGYLPYIRDLSSYQKEMHLRDIYIGYRGRELAYRYGSLGREKVRIGRAVKAYCKKSDSTMPIDIETHASHRIYGDSWYRFLSNCRCLLGTESGANVFDYTGLLRRADERNGKGSNHINYQEFYRQYLVGKERQGVMNQVSPKVFEAIMLGVVLILYEGEYSGVLMPGEHYIALKKDHSNIDAVISAVRDVEFLDQIKAKAYRDVVDSQEYSYKRFVGKLDTMLDTVAKNHRKSICYELISEGFDPDQLNWHHENAVRTLYSYPHCTPDPLGLNVRYYEAITYRRVAPIPSGALAPVPRLLSLTLFSHARLVASKIICCMTKIILPHIKLRLCLELLARKSRLMKAGVTFFRLQKLVAIYRRTLT